MSKEQKKIDELLETSNKMMVALQTQKTTSRKQATNTNKDLQVFEHCKQLMALKDDAVNTLIRMKTKGHSGTTNCGKKEKKLRQKRTRKLNDRGWGLGQSPTNNTELAQQ